MRPKSIDPKISDQIAHWLTSHPQPAVELPKTRTTQQWAAWLHAEGFLNDEPQGLSECD